jgi:hypothetical protein
MNDFPGGNPSIIPKIHLHKKDCREHPAQDPGHKVFMEISGPFVFPIPGTFAAMVHITKENATAGSKAETGDPPDLAACLRARPEPSPDRFWSPAPFLPER